ncbi:MAG: transcriptional regulator GcvA [Alphaproteobacteria bacterium]|nr:transcriptional regulator GcvA [Alphaproteobacteria bacterium]
MRDLPSTMALLAFETAGRTLSFTEAARELNLTQGAISHQVKNLEGQLGVKLFHRDRQRLRLTDNGAAYLPYVREATARLRAGSEYLSARADSGILTVSVSPNFAAKWLVHRLGEFISGHPDIDLRISASMDHIDFARNDVDMAVRHGTGDWPDLHVVPLAREEIFPVCSPKLLESGPPLEAPSDLARHVLLHDLSRNDWPLWFAAADVEPVDVSRGPQFDQTSMVIDAAVEGQGVALARRVLAARDMISGRLVRLFDVALPAPYGYFVVCPKASADLPKIAKFRDWLVSEAASDVRALGGSL